ncbi:General stress protein 69 [Roseovarius albus]|uniref:General stress protein 69 n=1 Tax=Roseovarius albus TaxID=1247867 RepID=A0A1X6YZT4_9RHOB|nr:aldo/keto reductase [Roseovarius albus]SLN36547.1 General stress protein 69 [Roseovarius albus]
MRTITLGGVEKPASVIGLGTMIFHPDTQARDEAILNAFVSAGGTYVDTAEIYGAVEQYGYSEQVIGDWLAADPARRDKIVLATKGLIPGFCKPLYGGEGAQISADFIHRAIDGSLERLKTDGLDLWMFHRDDPSHDIAPLIDALDEEVRAGRIKAYGASNWTTKRIDDAINYARSHGKAELTCSSPAFSLARSNEPFWPNTAVANDADRTWHSENQLPLIAWSALGRGFFAHGRAQDHSNADLVRVFYSDGNFERKRRAEALAADKGVSLYAIALAFAVNQPFPAVALNGAGSPAHVLDSVKAGDLTLSTAEMDWLDLSSNERP